MVAEEAQAHIIRVKQQQEEEEAKKQYSGL